MKNSDNKIQKERELIFEMIDASIELSLKKGRHELENGCNCIRCINERKRLLYKPVKEWKHAL